MKKYKLFLEAFMEKDKEKAVEIIINYLKDKTNVDLHPYDELWHIKRGGEYLTGQLFLSLKTSKAIRINWLKSDIRNQIHSIDVWNNFIFEIGPEFTLMLREDVTVVKVLPEVVKFFNNPLDFIELSKNLELQTTENYDPKSELEEWQGKRKRAKSPESVEKIERRIKQLMAIISIEEKAEKDSDKIGVDDLKIDIFKAIELYTIQVARGKSNSLIVSGQAGVGKTSVVTETLKSLGMVPDVHYYKSTGTITTAGLFETLFKNRNRLLIFDDCDAVLKDADSINLLKGALDTYQVRELSKITKGNTFDSTGMSDVEIEERWQEGDGKLLPNRFEFKGQVIFISNLHEDKIDNAILSRSLHVDVNLTKDEVVGRMRDIMKRISPELDMTVKQEALDYLVYITENYPVKFDLNIRTLIHAINLRSGNDETMTISGREEPVWKLLIKKYLVKTK
jgi:DNA replication protein DnaC